MMLFDAAARDACTVSETRTNTPLQALALLNEVVFVEAARVLAARVLAEAGAALTDKALDELYLKLNTLYYGRECVIDPDIRHEWLRIPHFYRAFYVYQSATGFSAAIYLDDRIHREGDEAREKYFSFLKSGGSIPPIEALKNAGADMTRPGVIRGAMKVFEDTVAQLEKLIG